MVREIVLMFSVVVLAGSAALGPGLPALREAPPVRPLVAWMGPSTSATEPGFLRITAQDKWSEFWRKHTGEKLEKNGRGWAVVPEIDFSVCMVVAYVRGPSVNRDGERVEAIDEIDGVVRLRFDSISYQTASFGDKPDSGVAVRPYGIWVLPRSTKPLVIEENIQGLIGQPPVWKEQKRFDAL